MAAFTIDQYVASLLPNVTSAIPGYTPAIAINGAMALYWTYLFPTEIPPTLDETELSERQKYMIALRVAVTLLPIINGWFTTPQVIEAGAGPATVKFQDLSKMLKVTLPMWETDLSNLEAAEDIFFNLLPSIPAFRLNIRSGFEHAIGETLNIPVFVPESDSVIEG